MQAAFEAMARIQDVFSRWRELGSLKLADGTELIGRHSVDEQDCWLHAVFPRLDQAAVRRMEELLQRPLPLSLRRFYCACGGMVLFGGLFRLHGLRRQRGLLVRDRLDVDDIVALNHELACTWKSDAAIAIATSEWDASVYVVNMGDDQEEIVRVTRSSGAVLERTRDVWTLVADKLYRLDQLFVR